MAPTPPPLGDTDHRTDGHPAPGDNLQVRKREKEHTPWTSPASLEVINREFERARRGATKDRDQIQAIGDVLYADRLAPVDHRGVHAGEYSLYELARTVAEERGPDAGIINLVPPDRDVAEREGRREREAVAATRAVGEPGSPELEGP